MPVKHFYLTGRFFLLPRLYRIDGGKVDARVNGCHARKEENPRSAFGAPAGFSFSS